MTTDLHVTEIPSIVDGLEARIRADAAKAIEDRAQTIQWLAEETLLKHPFLESTVLDMIQPLCRQGLSEDDIGLAFADLIDAVKEQRKFIGDHPTYLAREGIPDDDDGYHVVDTRLQSDIEFAVLRLLDIEASR